MKLLLTVVALVAVSHGAPTTTHTMEIGSDGVSGSILNVPLVDIVVNTIKDTVSAGTVITPVEAESVNVVDQAQNSEPVNVVEQAQNLKPVNVVDEVAPTPIIVVDQPVEVISVPELHGNPIDVISVNPVAPQPTPEAVVLPAPAPAEVIQVPAPIVLPEPTPAEVVAVPEPVVIVPEPTPAEVVAVPEPVVVAPEPIQIIEVAPETSVAAEADESSGQIINVILNFIFGENGALSSVEVPAHVIPQIVTAPRV